MGADVLEIPIRAKTDEFVNSLSEIKKRCQDLTKQMQEIDKQLKTENIDRVQKLGEKLEHAKRAAEAAAEETNLYGDILDIAISRWRPRRKTSGNRRR